jgi:acyl carrier protein
MTVDEYHTTISSKVSGTWNLHKVALEKNIELDFFTLLSSVSGIVGQKGQANYAAANVFMDAFASYRQLLGLRANSTDLGVIEDVGYVAEQGGMQQHFDKTLWTGINESMLCKILGYSILQQLDPLNSVTSSQLITGIMVPQPEDSTLLKDARFSGLCIPTDDDGLGPSKSGDDASKDIKTFFVLLRSKAEAAAVLTSAVDIVNKQFTKMLRLPNLVEPGKALTAYGLDSLASVELRNWIRTELGAELTTLEINNAPSLFSLCEKIILKIKIS